MREREGGRQEPTGMHCLESEREREVGWIEVRGCLNLGKLIFSILPY